MGRPPWPHPCAGWIILVFALQATRFLLVNAAAGSRHSERQPASFPPPAVGLPRECLTYAQRYPQRYHIGLQHSHMYNMRHLDSQLLVVLTAHTVQQGGRVPLDLILSMRALAAEVTGAGYHFVILFQVPRPTYYQYYLQGLPKEFNRQHALALLPPDLWPFVQLHDHEDDFEHYPQLGAGDDPALHPAHGWGVGPRASYVALTRLMARYRHYTWAWCIERDVRWTGPDWGHLLKAALSLGIRATQEELDADPYRRLKQERLASRAPPDSLEGLPDLLTFAPIFLSNKWRGLKHNMGSATKLYETTATVFSASRRFWDQAHASCQAGIGSHLEAFLPTLPMNAGMKVAGIIVERHPALPGSWHCCGEFAGLAYSDFHNRTAACSTSLLLHPVKNTEPFWPRVRVPAFAAHALPNA